MSLQIDCNWPLWPRQEQAFESEANDQLFGGASEGGKSYMLRVAICSAGVECEGLQMTLIRKKSKDIITNHIEGDRGFRKLLYPLTSKGIVDLTQDKIRFPKENVCNFRHCQDERQFDSAQGNENQIVAIDEAPQIQERLIRAFRGWCRITPDHLARQPEFWQKKLPWIIQTGNPLGPSVGYYRKHYVKARGEFEIEKVGGFRRQYVPSKAQDNKSVDLEAHSARLAEMGDPELARALDTGDWDAITGNYFATWDEDRHVVKPFKIPDYWLRFRTFDYGSFEPWACVWWAVSPGVTIHPGTIYEAYLPRGCLVGYREWYGCKAEYPKNEGESMITHLAPQGWSNKDIANGIAERTEADYADQPTFTDGFPFIKLGGRSIAHEFAEAGVPLTLGELDRKNRGAQMTSKLNGLKLMAGSDHRFPMMVFFETNKYCRDYIPMIGRNESPAKAWDYAEHGEATHIVDCCTLAAVAHMIVNDAPRDMDKEVRQAITDRRTVKPSVKDIILDLPF